MSKTYVACKYCDSLTAEVDTNTMLLSSPPQLAARCDKCNGVTYVPTMTASDNTWYQPGATRTLEQKVEDLLQRVAMLEARVKP